MFATVSFSWTLSPTRPQETPCSLKTSFCGSMTTSAVSFLSNFMVQLPRHLRLDPEVHAVR